MTTEANSKQFYVYLHSAPEIGVFYVGKGDEARCNVVTRHNPHHSKICMKYGTDNIAVTLIPCFNEQAALELETAMIIEMRKAGVDLVNQTAGNATVENAAIKDLTQRLEGMERYVTRISATSKKIVITEKFAKTVDVHADVLNTVSKRKKEGILKSDFLRLNRSLRKLSDYEQDKVIQELIDENKITIVKTKQVSGQIKTRYVATEFIDL